MISAYLALVQAWLRDGHEQQRATSPAPDAELDILLLGIPATQDLSVTCSGLVVKANLAVMANYCKYFERILEGATSPTSSSCPKVVDIPSTTFDRVSLERFFQLAYTGRLGAAPLPPWLPAAEDSDEDNDDDPGCASHDWAQWFEKLMQVDEYFDSRRFRVAMLRELPHRFELSSDMLRMASRCRRLGAHFLADRYCTRLLDMESIEPEDPVWTDVARAQPGRALHCWYSLSRLMLQRVKGCSSSELSEMVDRAREQRLLFHV